MTVVKELKDDVDYIITTSGTTGEAKAIFVTSSSLLPNIVDIQKAFGVHDKDAVLLCSPLTFDPSLIDVFVSLSAGCQLVVVPASQKLTHAAHMLEQLEISILQCTPSLAKMLLPSGDLVYFTV